jgi:uncharacterized delta-60 repeat protein
MAGEIIIIPRINPMRFVLQAPAALVKSALPDFQLMRNMDLPGIYYEKFYQKWQTNDAVTLQVWANYDVLTLSIRNEGDDSEVAALGAVKQIDNRSTMIAPYDIYEFSVPMGALGEGRYYGIMTGSASGLDPFTAESELFWVKAIHRHTRLLTAYNYDNALGIDWRTDAALKLRLKALLGRPKVSSEVDVYPGDNNAPILLKEVLTKAWMLESAESMPFWMHEKLAELLALDYKDVDGMAVEKVGPTWEWEYEDHEQAGPGQVLLQEVEYEMINRHDNAGRDVLPVAPSGLLAVTVDAESIMLTWSADEPAATGYEVWRSLSPGSGYTKIYDLGVVSSKLDDDDGGGLAGDTTYYYKVRAVIDTTPGPFGNVASATTDVAAVAKPTGLSVVGTSDTEIHGAFLAAAAYDSAKVYRAPSSGGSYTLVATISGPLPIDVIEFDDSGLTAETQYFYVVTGVVGGDESAYSDEAQATTLEASVYLINPGANAAIYTIAQDSNGDLFLGGTFSSYKGVSKNYIVKIFGNGPNKYQIDSSFNIGTGFDQNVQDIAIDQNDKVYVVGAFTSYNGSSKSRIVRLNPDGSVDTGFNVGTGFNTYGTGNSVVVDSSNKVYVSGAFTAYNGVPINRIIKLNEDGTKDASFDVGTGFNNLVRTLMIDGANKIYALGNFTTYKGVTENYIIRLNADGSKDSGFNNSTSFNNIPIDFAFDSNGKLIVVGTFTTYKGSGAVRIARINTDGSLDSGFATAGGLNNSGVAVGVDEDDKVYAMGLFTAYQGVAELYLTRILSDGSNDGTFVNTPGGLFIPQNFGKILRMTNGSILVGGSFGSFNGDPTGSLIKFNSYS